MIPVRHLLPFICIILLPQTIHSSMKFVMNPGCNETQCITPGYPAIFYASQYLDGYTIHILYSSLDELTISILQTREGYIPKINYTALFQGNYPNAITFGDIVPMNSLTLIIRRLMKFNDANDTGRIDANDTSIESYWLKNLKTNITSQDNDTVQPAFLLPLNDIGGLLTIDINYPGEATREEDFPKLHLTPTSYYINLALEASNISYAPTRFAFEFYVIQFGVEGTELSKTRYIDDQYTPGVFKVWQLKSLSPLYTTSMLWKPIVYQSVKRTTEENTLMQIYDLQNNVLLNQSIDQGIFRALYNQFYVSAFNISLGTSKDKFFINTNYSFIQFTAGLDTLDIDSIKQFITLALIIAIALPGLVSSISLLFIMKRKCTRAQPSGYDPIDY